LEIKGVKLVQIARKWRFRGTV